MAFTCPDFVKNKNHWDFPEDSEATSCSHKMQMPQGTSQRQNPPVQAAYFSCKIALPLITNGFVSLKLRGKNDSKVYLLQ